MRPTIICETVYDIDFETLYSKGAKNIIFDIDNTLITYAEEYASDKLRELIEKLSKMGFRMYVLSNGHSDRAKKFSKDLGLVFEGDAFKPSQKGYKRLQNQYGVEPSQTIMIGDQVFTDIWGAKRFKCMSVLVRPIDLSNEPGFVKFKRIFEKIFIKRWKSK